VVQLTKTGINIGESTRANNPNWFINSIPKAFDEKSVYGPQIKKEKANVNRY